MTPEEDKLLCEKYPKIFKNQDILNIETYKPWGFECGSGWFKIIDVLCNQIQLHINEINNLNEDYQVVASQVKEKFGGLRFYYDGGDDAISGMVLMAESMAYVTCEHCGNSGKRQPGGWVRTLCDHCQENFNKKKI